MMKYKASTLVEIVFYFTLLGVLLLVSMTFAIQILSVNSLSNNIHEVKANVDFIEEKISYAIKTAESVDDLNSVFNDDNGVLSLNMPDAGVNPTQFYLSDGLLYIKEGLANPVAISTDLVEFEHLRFEKISADKVLDQITITANISPAGTDISNLDTNFTINTSVSLRQ